MKFSEDSLLRETSIKICLIAIPLLIVAIYITMHDDLARSSNAELSLEQMATTGNCQNLKFMTMNHQDDWFPSKYIVLAKEKEIELKC